MPFLKVISSLYTILKTLCQILPTIIYTKPINIRQSMICVKLKALQSKLKFYLSVMQVKSLIWLKRTLNSVRNNSPNIWGKDWKLVKTNGVVIIFLVKVIGKQVMKLWRDFNSKKMKKPNHGEKRYSVRTVIL